MFEEITCDRIVQLDVDLPFFYLRRAGETSAQAKPQQAADATLALHPGCLE